MRSGAVASPKRLDSNATRFERKSSKRLSSSTPILFHNRTNVSLNWEFFLLTRATQTQLKMSMPKWLPSAYRHDRISDYLHCIIQGLKSLQLRCIESCMSALKKLEGRFGLRGLSLHLLDACCIYFVSALPPPLPRRKLHRAFTLML